MNTRSSVTRRLVGGVIIAASLLGVAAVPEAGAPQSAQGGARLLTRDQTFSESLRATTTACNRANVTLNPIDARGLAAAVPGPAARP